MRAYIHPLFRLTGAVLLVLAAVAAPVPFAQAANLDTTADHVFGQPDMVTHTPNYGGLSASSLNYAGSVALDLAGNLYVADTLNNRVLEYDAPLTDATADRVFGQPNFITNTANNGGISAASLFGPAGLALDAQGNLYVADTGNNRVLLYLSPLISDAAADEVMGQPNFSSNSANNGGVSADSLAGPRGLAVDADGRLYVADTINNRVLVYYSPLISDEEADRMLGQHLMTSNAVNDGGLSAHSLYGPFGLALDLDGRLYVADTSNNRVLEYDTPFSNATATRVFGQPTFITNTANSGGLSAISLHHPYDVALDNSTGRLYVADTINNRVLEYDGPLSNAAADRVFGQPGFNTNTANNGGISAASLSGPRNVELDPAANLYVVDYVNIRVLKYDVPAAHSVPTLTGLSPSAVAAGSPAFTLTVAGTGFVAGSTVRWNGSNRPTTFINSSRLSAAIAAADVSAGGPFAVTVFTPGPGGGTSNLANVTLYARVREDTLADVVQGQPDFTTYDDEGVVPAAARLLEPQAVAIDRNSGRLFVADRLSHQVLSWANAPAFANGQPADLVIGRLDFIPNNAEVSANLVIQPRGVALDGQGNLYVADTWNSRVLRFAPPLTSGMAASQVFGQGGSFTSNIFNNGGVNANSLGRPYGLAVDASGNLYVADADNNRVLEYDSPATTDSTADRVFGQPAFNTNTANNGGLSAQSLNFPTGVALDALGNLVVADQNNHRVLEYNTPLTAGPAADRVFGQPAFNTNVSNNSGLSATSLFGPAGVALDTAGSLYVADTNNNRVLKYDDVLTDAAFTNQAADEVFGQPSFITNTVDNGLSAASLHGPADVALDGAGNLYVADTVNNRVLEYDWALIRLWLPLVQR